MELTCIYKSEHCKYAKLIDKSVNFFVLHRIKYVLKANRISGTDTSAFSINATNGVLTTKGATSKTSYSVDIEATNTKTGKGKVALTVTVPCSVAEQLTSILAVIAMAAAAARLF